MKLTTFHQVLVIGAMSLCAILVLRGWLLFFGGRGQAHAVMASFALLGGVALFVYLKRFRRKLARNRDAE